MTLRNLTMVLALLVVAGCGCNDDSSPPNVFPVPLVAQVGVKTQLPPIPVMPPPPIQNPFKIDVTVILDDGLNMIQKNLGILPANPGDPRTRMQAAQAIFRNLQANLLARFNAEWVAQHPGTTPPPLDLAFAVARYEDFGGEFAEGRNRGNARNPDVTSDENDRDTRPFILNMPILRVAHPNFADLFDQALVRAAPGDGKPYIQLAPGFFASVTDPQTGIEALWQISAPADQNGNIGGFDADGNGNTLGSGQPTSLDAGGNPQTLPGGTGDVPAVRFIPYPANSVAPLNTNNVGEDDDGEPLFQVADETGTGVTIPNPTAGGTMPSPASGNLGQVGWRPDAARFAILASSLATVAPTETQPQGVPELPGILPPPADNEMVSSTAGAPDAPREARTVLLGAYDGGPLFLQGTPYTERRTGLRDGVKVAPTNARTVQETIDRLNALDIEVLFLGTPIAGGLDVKPGVTGVNGDIDATINADAFDPQDPAKVQPDFAPWFWMNATNTLTMPPVTSVPRAGRVPSPVFGGDSSLFWAVYNMGDVWPLNTAAPFDEGGIRSVVVDDLAERIVAWIDGGFVTGGTTPAVRPPLPTVSYQVTLTWGPGANPDLIQSSPLDAGMPKTSFTTIVQVPTYYSDTPAPAPVTVSFPLPVDGPFIYEVASAAVALPASDTIPFEMGAAFQTLGNLLPSNTTQQQQILDLIKARGDGFTVDGMGNIVPLANETDPIIQAQGSVTITAHSSLAPGPGAQLVGVTRGCAIVNDLTTGQDPSDQVGGTCPFPANP